MDAQLKRGVIEVCVLSALLGGQTYGYRLIKDLAGHIEISESTLYPILKRLELLKCISVNSVEHNGRLRKYYSIEQAGKDRINEFLQDWQQLSGTIDYIKGEWENEQGRVFTQT